MKAKSFASNDGVQFQLQEQTNKRSNKQSFPRLSSPLLTVIPPHTLVFTAQSHTPDGIGPTQQRTVRADQVGLAPSACAHTDTSHRHRHILLLIKRSEDNDPLAVGTCSRYNTQGSSCRCMRVCSLQLLLAMSISHRFIATWSHVSLSLRDTQLQHQSCCGTLLAVCV